MNLNEQCLLKYLTNPIGIYNNDYELNSNVQKVIDFEFVNSNEKLFITNC